MNSGYILYTFNMDFQKNIRVLIYLYMKGMYV